MARRYKYVSAEDPNFLNLLNQELEDMDREIDNLKSQRVLLAGPSQRGTNRRDTLVRYRATVPSSGATLNTHDFVIPLTGANCIDGAPRFKIINWAGGISMEMTGPIPDVISGLAFIVTSINVQKIGIRMIRETTTTADAWDFFIVFRVSGTV